MLQNVASINLIYLIYLLCKKIFKICALNDIVSTFINPICVFYIVLYLKE